MNLKATATGILRVDAGAIAALNLVDPAITLATLAPFARVRPGTLVGTVKIISYAVAERAVEAACHAAAGALALAPVRLRSAG